MKNKLTDLNNYLFEQLERLMDDEVCNNNESTRNEIEKSKAIVNVSKAIIENSKVELDALKVAHEWNLKGKDMPTMLEYENGRTVH
jgi:hypothetical protein